MECGVILFGSVFSEVGLIMFVFVLVFVLLL